MILRKWREQQGLSRAALARMVGVSSVMIGYIESGQRNPGRGTVLAISKVTGISPLLLMFGEDFDANAIEPIAMQKSAGSQHPTSSIGRIVNFLLKR